MFTGDQAATGRKVWNNYLLKMLQRNDSLQNPPDRSWGSLCPAGWLYFLFCNRRKKGRIFCVNFGFKSRSIYAKGCQCWSEFYASAGQRFWFVQQQLWPVSDHQWWLSVLCCRRSQWPLKSRASCASRAKTPWMSLRLVWCCSSRKLFDIFQPCHAARQ